jgi:very-short-patch-repair endonuclease
VIDIQVGVAGYRIDLGVRHPKYPTVYLAGIECDGATYHNSKSARDRDRLRESVLRGKGWTILRVWSTDWFADADLQTDRLVTELQRLSTRPVTSQSDWTTVNEPPAMQATATESREGLMARSSFSAAPPNERFEPSLPAQRLASAGIDETEVKNSLRAFRESEIIRDFPELDPERCILREIMINKIVDARLDQPKDFTRKIPLWLRERTDGRQMKYLERICSIVEPLRNQGEIDDH